VHGADLQQEGLFSYFSPESRITRKHPLRPGREMRYEALTRLSDQFESTDAYKRHPTIVPDKLLRALLIQIFYSIHSEWLLCEQPDYDLLFL
jgi:transposase